MRTTLIGCCVMAFGVFSLGQSTVQASSEQIFHFVHARTPQTTGEIASVMRTIGEMSVKTSEDNPPSTLTVRGTAEQLALANWLFVELDQPAGAPANASAREYKLAGSADSVVRVYYVTNAETVQEFQEIATAIRTVAGIPRVFTYNETRAMVTRGTPDQMALTEWLLPLMDRPLGSPAQHGTSPQDVIPDPRDEGFTQVFYAGNAATVKDFQELATTLRTIALIRRVFTYNAARAIVVRGLATQLDMAAWLFNELDQPGGAQASGQGTSPRAFQAAGSDDVVRVFYFAHGDNLQDIQNIVAQIHASTSVQRAFSYGSRMGLVLRGTAAQMAAAEHLVQELDKP